MTSNPLIYLMGIAVLSLSLMAVQATAQTGEVVEDVTGNGHDLFAPRDLKTANDTFGKYGAGLEVKGTSPDPKYLVNNSTVWHMDGDMVFFIALKYLNASTNVENLAGVWDQFGTTCNWWRISTDNNPFLDYEHDTEACSNNELIESDFVSDNGFQTFALWRDASDNRVVLLHNGTVVANETYTNDPDTGASAPWSLVLGSRAFDRDFGLEGAIYEARIWNETVQLPLLQNLSDPDSDTLNNQLQGDELAAWFFGDTLPTTPPPGPTPVDFADGIDDFATSLGFRSVESQFFFGLSLVGIATVSTAVGARWVKSGQTKNWIIAGAGMLAAVFAVYIRFMELWMFVLAITLGGFAVVGDAKTITNTFSQIRDEFKEAVTATEEVPETPPPDQPQQLPPGAELEPATRPAPETAPLEDDVVFDQVDDVDDEIDVAGQPTEPVEPSDLADPGDVEPVEGAAEAVELDPRGSSDAADTGED